MERLLQMLGILAVLYAMYALSLKKWDYATEAKRQERRTLLKTKGVSNTFYFIHAGTLFLLNVFSGGLFTFYWLYRQWTAVPHGFRRLNAQPLPHGAFLRTVGGFITFFELNAIICRTCEYMRHKPPLPPWAWGTMWLGGLIGAIAAPGWTEKLIGYALFCAAPAVLQKRLNALPAEKILPTPKPKECFAAAAALGCALGMIALFRILL